MGAYAFASLLHGTALLIMSKTRWDLPNQRRLTMSLSFTEMCCCCYMVIRYAVVLTDNWRDEWGKIDTIFGGTLYIAFRLSLLHTVADRFMEIFFNVKYPLYMSIKKLNGLIVGSWLLALVFSFICLILRLYHHWMTATKLLLFTVLFLDVIIFVSACGTYSFFFLKVRAIRKSESIAVRKSERSNIGRSPVAMTLIWKKFKLPCYIV